MHGYQRMRSRGRTCSHEVRVDVRLPAVVVGARTEDARRSRNSRLVQQPVSPRRRWSPLCGQRLPGNAVRPAPSGSLKFQVLSESLIQSFSIPMGRVRSRARTVNVATHSSESLPCCRSRRAQEVVCRSRDGLDVTLKALAGSGSDAGDLRSQLDQVARFRVQKSLVAVAVDYSAL